LVATVTVTDLDAGDPARVGLAHPLVEAKLHAPSPAAGTIARPRLLLPLLEREAAPYVALVAGPGYGKTTLLAQWSAEASRHIAWLTLDDFDNDPAVLLAYLGAAYGRALGAAASAEVEQPVPAGQAIPRLLDRLHRTRRPVTLLLDDAHRLTDRASLDALAVLIDHLPPGFRVAIAARGEPGLPLARWRTGRRLIDVDEGQLALDPAETAALVRAAGWSLDTAGIRALVARTEGWAAATYLAALGRGRGGGSSASAAEVTGRDRFIAAYLAAEVRDGLPREDVELLAQTSVLESVTPEAAVALTGDEGAALRLRSIARRNVLVHELGSTPPAYRYHNLLREFLLEELERERPGAARSLHARAARWHASGGRHELAVEHALLAGDDGDAVRLVTAALIPTLHAGHGATVDRWLATFDDAAYRRHRPLAALAAWTHLVEGRADEAERMGDIVEAARFEGLPAIGASTLESHRLMLRAVMCRHGAADALANAQAAADAGPTGEWRPTVLWLLGSLRWLTGDVDGGAQTLAQAAGGPPTPAGATALAKRAAILLRLGDWRGADALATESLAMLRASRWDALLTAFVVHAIAARVAIARGDTATGRAELVRAQLVRPTASPAAPWMSVDALLELARAYLAISDPAGAQTALREAEAIVRLRPGLGTLVGELVELRRRVGGAADVLAGSSTLTSAELRVLPLLPTYLSFQDIADRLGISRNTVKTHAMSIYGKLWASSRGEAVERAVELGLLEPYPGLDGFRGGGSDGLDVEDAG
jgi:LuxR family maltose regulon positive regulatory protein